MPIGFSRPRNATMIAENPYPAGMPGTSCPAGPADLAHAGQAREPARNQQRRPDDAPFRDSRRSGRRRRIAEYRHIEPEPVPCQQHVRRQQRPRARTGSRYARATLGEQARQQRARLEQPALRKVEALRDRARGRAPGRSAAASRHRPASATSGFRWRCSACAATPGSPPTPCRRACPRCIMSSSSHARRPDRTPAPPPRWRWRRA